MCQSLKLFMKQLDIGLISPNFYHCFIDFFIRYLVIWVKKTLKFAFEIYWHLVWHSTVQGRNPYNIWFIFWEKLWLHKFILKFTDLYLLCTYWKSQPFRSRLYLSRFFPALPAKKSVKRRMDKTKISQLANWTTDSW